MINYYLFFYFTLFFKSVYQSQSGEEDAYFQINNNVRSVQSIMKVEHSDDLTETEKKLENKSSILSSMNSSTGEKYEVNPFYEKDANISSSITNSSSKIGDDFEKKEKEIFFEAENDISSNKNDLNPGTKLDNNELEVLQPLNDSSCNHKSKIVENSETQEGEFVDLANNMNGLIEIYKDKLEKFTANLVGDIIKMHIENSFIAQNTNINAKEKIFGNEENTLMKETKDFSKKINIGELKVETYNETSNINEYSNNFGKDQKHESEVLDKINRADSNYNGENILNKNVQSNNGSVSSDPNENNENYLNNSNIKSSEEFENNSTMGSSKMSVSDEIELSEESENNSTISSSKMPVSDENELSEESEDSSTTSSSKTSDSTEIDISDEKGDYKIIKTQEDESFDFHKNQEREFHIIFKNKNAQDEEKIPDEFTKELLNETKNSTDHNNDIGLSKEFKCKNSNIRSICLKCQLNECLCCEKISTPYISICIDSSTPCRRTTKLNYIIDFSKKNSSINICLSENEDNKDEKNNNSCNNCNNDTKEKN